MQREVVNPWTWQDQYGFVQAVRLSEGSEMLLCAGQTSVDADGSPLHSGDMGAQLGQALTNLETVLSQAGFSLADVARLNYYVTDVKAFTEQSEAVGQRLAAAGCRPASTLLGVAALAFPDLMVELEATAIR